VFERGLFVINGPSMASLGFALLDYSYPGWTPTHRPLIFTAKEAVCTTQDLNTIEIFEDGLEMKVEFCLFGIERDRAEPEKLILKGIVLLGGGEEVDVLIYYRANVRKGVIRKA
jgi:hypothetical protein